MAKITFNSKNYELNKKTMSIATLQQAMYDAEKITEQYEKEYDFAKAVINDDDFLDIFGTYELNEIDLDDLTLVCNMIDDAYKEKIYEDQRKKAERLINSNNKAIEKVIEAGKSVKNITDATKINK